MDYAGIFDLPELEPILLSILQTFTIFIIVLAGLKLVGRRVFAEQTPQDLIILLLIAESCDLGLTHEQAGYWGTIASVVTILLMGWVCDRVEFLRKLTDGNPVTLYKNGRLNKNALKKYSVDEQDLDVAAHEYGLASYREFNTIILEGDGKITGIIHRSHSLKKKS